MNLIKNNMEHLTFKLTVLYNNKDAVHTTFDPKVMPNLYHASILIRRWDYEGKTQFLIVPNIDILMMVDLEDEDENSREYIITFDEQRSYIDKAPKNLPEAPKRRRM
jgi:hypothetical protein